MTTNPRSSSGERPLGPLAQRGILNSSGFNGGPVRLPEELQTDFIDQFNKIYHSHDLQIKRVTEDK